MYWYNLNSDILKNMEIQIPLDVYQEETPYPTNLSFPKNKKREKKLTNINDYQSKLVEYKENHEDTKENNIKNLNTNENKSYIQTTLVDYGLKLSKNNISGYMSKLYDKKDLIKRSFYSIFGVDVVDKKEDNKLFIEPTGLVSYVDPICPICGRKNIIKYGPDDRTLVKKDGNKGKYRVQGYMCKDCDKTFFASLNNSLNSETQENIELNKKIKKLHGISGLSLDKMAQIVGIFEDVSISHTSVQNILEEDLDSFDYCEELVILPQDTKINGKTSKDRKVTDCTIVYMLKKNNVKISGDAIADEVFLNMMKNKQYLVTIMDQNIPDMPIGIAILKTRKFEAMKAFFDFVFKNQNFKFLTSDMLNVYEAIATDNKIPHQQCIFHSMKYVGEMIFDELKKKGKYTIEDKIWFLTLLTEYREILREFDYEKAIDKKKNFIAKIDELLKNGELPKVFSQMIKHLTKRFKKLTTHLREDNINRTSNKCETFNSLPQIRHIKNSSKSPKVLLCRIGSIIMNYIPNKRTLQTRHKNQNYPC